ncbi:9312_t:CDS:2 [Cetraspora pellucida]|uniref:9312_t:CDS:1 n=1 Tax=Cetraspora pellucida TaxID=1433469 RepID=A0ACA9KTV1_9GLOM|nr:9312_t:CDS:2 [Cetraspora pellucida]
MRFSGNNDEYKQSEFTNKAGVGDDECENGDNPIIRAYSPRPSTPKKSSPPTPTRTRRHSLISSEEKYNLSSPPKGYTPNKIVTPADAAAVLAASLTPHKDNFINYDSKKLYYSPYKHNEEKPQKRQLKRSHSFNQSTNQVIDVAEVLATTVSLVRDNNRKLDRLSDEVRSEQSSENDMDSDDSDSWQPSSRREIENEITQLAAKLESMKQKYEEQIRGKNRLIEELEYALKKSEKDCKKKRNEIERLEIQIEAQKRAIDELVAEQQNLMARSQSPDPEQAEAFRLLEQELDEKNKLIDDLKKRVQIVSTNYVAESKEKDMKLDLISNQLMKYKTLEAEWDDKQKTLDSLSSQLEVLKKREVEINEKDSLIESLNIRLDTSQKVIAELREKHAPHDLLRQLRQKDYIIDNLTQRVENIDADMKDKDDQIEALATCLAEEKKQAEQLEDELAQIDPLKNRVEEMEVVNNDLQQQISQKEKILFDLECKYKESLKNSCDNSEKLKAQEQNINALRQEVAQLKQAMTVKVSEVRDKERHIATLENETAHMRSNYQRLINALTEKDQRIAYFEQNLENLKNIQNAAKSESQERESKINKNEVRLNALQKVLNNKIEACRDYEKKIVDLEKDLESLKRQIDESKTSSSEKEIKITKLVKMNRQLKEEVTELKEKMEAKEQELITIKSRIPQPVPNGKSPAASVRSTSSSKAPKSRVSSMYSVSGGESSSDETANGSRIRKHSSLSGIESPALKKKSTLDPSRRLSDNPRATTLTRTRSSPPTSTLSSVRRNNLTTTLPKSRTPSTPNTVDVLKKKRDATITPKKESSPINRSAVNQRKRDMVVLNHMLSGVAPQKRPSADNSAGKKKSTDSVSSDSEREAKTGPAKKRTSDLATIMEKIRTSGDDSTKKVTRAKVTRPTIDTKTPKSPVMARTPLTRPLPSKK